MIPAAEPQIADAEDWRARMETVKGTFSSRVWQICNAALDRSIIAYNENSDDEERRRCREETETLAWGWRLTPPRAASARTWTSIWDSGR